MSLKDFQTFLIPTLKNAFVQFWQKPTAANPNGQILEGSFTRPNSAEDPTRSGQAVFEADGTLRELSEDEAPWTYPVGGSVNGCPYLDLQPGEKSFVKTFDPSADEGTANGISYAAHDWGLGPLLQNAIVFPVNSGTLNYRYTNVTTTSGSIKTISFFVLMNDESAPAVGQSSGDPSIDFSIAIEQSRNTVNNVDITTEQVGSSNVYLVIATSNGTSGVDASRQGVIQYAEQSGKGFKISGITVVERSYFAGHIPTYGTALTRNFGTAQLNNLVLDGLVSNEELSLFIEITNIGAANGVDCISVEGSSGNEFNIRFDSNKKIILRALRNGTQESIGPIDVLSKSKVVITHNSVLGVTKFFFNGSKLGEVNGPLVELNTLKMKSSPGAFSLENISLTPFVIQESQAELLTA